MFSIDYIKQLSEFMSRPTWSILHIGSNLSQRSSIIRNQTILLRLQQAKEFVDNNAMFLDITYAYPFMGGIPVFMPPVNMCIWPILLPQLRYASRQPPVATILAMPEFTLRTDISVGGGLAIVAGGAV